MSEDEANKQAEENPNIKKMSFSVEELRKRKVMIGIPMYGGVNHMGTMISVNNLTSKMVELGIPHQLNILSNESLIPRARNYIADMFMRSGCTHLFFIDSDIGFEVDGALAAIGIADPDSEFDVVTGPYPKKVISFEKIKMAVDKGYADQNPNVLENYVGDFVFNGVDGQTSFRLDQPFQVSEAGTGFMLIQRRVFERIADAFPDYLYKPDHARNKGFEGSRKIMQYFHCEIEQGFTNQDLLDFVRYTAEYSTVGSKKKKNDKTPKQIANDLLQKLEKSSLRYLSEDYFFTRRARDTGSKVWMLPWIRLNHAGTYIFQGNLLAIAQIGASATILPSDIGRVSK